MIYKQVIKELEEEFKKVIEVTKREFSQLRSGRANPKFVEGIRVDYYGTPTILKEIANITVPEARMILITPWDTNVIKDIEKALLQSDLGITPICDNKVIRLIIPPLSEERRNELLKITKKIAEEGKISIRTVRGNGKERLKKLQNEKKISEDDRFTAEKELQDLTDKYIKEIDKLLEDKSKEIREF